jgi:hypothetical protein
VRGSVLSSLCGVRCAAVRAGLLAKLLVVGRWPVHLVTNRVGGRRYVRLCTVAVGFAPNAYPIVSAGVLRRRGRSRAPGAAGASGGCGAGGSVKSTVREPFWPDHPRWRIASVDARSLAFCGPYLPSFRQASDTQPIVALSTCAVANERTHALRIGTRGQPDVPQACARPGADEPPAPGARLQGGTRRGGNDRARGSRQIARSPRREARNAPPRWAVLTTSERHREI